MKPIRKACDCQLCAVCKSWSICAKCRMCARCHQHAPGCPGCPGPEEGHATEAPGLPEDWRYAIRQVSVLIRNTPETLAPLMNVSAEQRDRLEIRMESLAESIEDILVGLYNRPQEGDGK